MVSGKNSKAVRNARSAVVAQRSIPWGLIIGAGLVLVFAVVAIGYPLVLQAQENERTAALAPFRPTAENPDPSLAIDGVEVIEYDGGQHVEATQQVAYTHSPPFGGAHDFAWATCTGVVYPEPVRSENIVHSLEHGAVWIAYDPDQVSGAALDMLADRVDGEAYLVLSPFPDLDQPISLQSWGHQLALSDPADPRIDQFIAALRLNQNTHPEPGATCNEQATGAFERSDPPPYAPPPAPGAPGAILEDGAVAPDSPPAAGS